MVDDLVAQRLTELLHEKARLANESGVHVPREVHDVLDAEQDLRNHLIGQVRELTEQVAIYDANLTAANKRETRLATKVAELTEREANPMRYAITVCEGCHRGGCPGHLADEAVERYGLALNKAADERDDLAAALQQVREVIDACEVYSAEAPYSDAMWALRGDILAALGGVTPKPTHAERLARFGSSGYMKVGYAEPDKDEQ